MAVVNHERVGLDELASVVDDLKRVYEAAMGPDGHASTRAAIIYLHAANGRDRLIADAMNDHLAGKFELPGTES